MPNITAQITGIDELKAKLGAVPAKVSAGIVGVFQKYGASIVRNLATYPPQPSRTRSQHFNTYVRGVGTYPKAAFGASGLRAGARKGKFGRVHYTSEQLGRKWTSLVAVTDTSIVLTLGNSASYASYVQRRDAPASDPKKHQTSFHLRTGWKTAEDVIEAEILAIVTDCSAVIQGALNG